MEISLIYVLIAAEILLILSGLSITLIFLLVRKQKTVETTPTPALQQAEDELDAIDLSNSYIDFLDQQIDRNSTKLQQVENSEAQQPGEEDSSEEGGDEAEDTDKPSPPPDELQSELLQAREAFLLLEKEAADKAEHEIHFWDSLYSGIKTLLEKYKTSETATLDLSTHSVESKEKVFYIETQGKKIDGEVNKLKDIIYEQENALSSMKKAMANAVKSDEDTQPEVSEAFEELRKNIEAIERQLNDSKMCMEVLEMENDRLQEEVDSMDARHNALFEEKQSTENDTVIDLDQMKEVVEQQELKIEQLIESIESLEIDAAQSEKLKQTINDFSRTSKEMMSCIVILEEENERLQAESAEHTAEDEQTGESTASTDEEDGTALKAQVSSLEEELIKKDVAFAKLQDEFSSMETEYLAMYEAMHGDNG